MSRDGSFRSTAWNYRADVPHGDFAIDDPDASVQEARWFSPTDAIPLVGAVPYPPLSHPVAAHLEGAAPTRWTFTFDLDLAFADRTYEIAGSPL